MEMLLSTGILRKVYYRILWKSICNSVGQSGRINKKSL